MRKQVYCGFCRLSHKVYTHKHVPWLGIIGFAGLSGIVSFLVWRDFHWASLLVFGLGAICAEFLMQYRWRQSIKCKGCGFDPMIYKRSPEQAAQQVKAYLEKRKIDPSFLLKPRPHLPQPAQKKGQRSDPRLQDYGA